MKRAMKEACSITPSAACAPVVPSFAADGAPLWVARGRLLWAHRLLFGRVLLVSLTLSIATAFLIPKHYTAVARIMPPDQQGSGALMLAALAGRAGSLGSLSTLAGDLFGGHTTSALFMDLLRSGTVASQLIDRFNLQQVYWSRYRVDAAKRLARRTTIVDDKKSGVISISVEDTDPVRARDMVAAYLEGLNNLVTHTTTSAAKQERLFLEQRLVRAKAELEHAQVKLSEFSTRNGTIDIREQTHAMVDAGARVEGELLAERAGLQSLRQTYGEGSVHVRASAARIASLQGSLEKLAGSAASADPGAAEKGGESTAGPLYPPLRQLPRLGVAYADLVREVRVQETVYELLTQQYELARLEEAKDVPVVRVIDPPGIPEKKSFPPRLWFAAALTASALGIAAFVLLGLDHWQQLESTSPGKAFVLDVKRSLRRTPHPSPATGEQEPA